MIKTYFVTTAAVCAGLFMGGTMAADGAAAKQLAPNARPKIGLLAPADIQDIRRVGQAVLGVRQGATLDPVQEAMRQEVKMLGAELDQAVKTLFNTPPKLTIGKGTATLRASGKPATLIEGSAPRIQLVQGPDGKTIQPESSLAVPAAAPAPAPVLPEMSPMQSGNATMTASDAFSAVRTRLDDLRGQAGILAQRVDQNSAQGTHTVQLIAKAMAMQEEVRNALTLNNNVTQEDAIRLSKLRDRLRPRTLTEVLAERDAESRAAGPAAPEPTPSISTLIRHR